jgi:hypothetical protein
MKQWWNTKCKIEGFGEKPVPGTLCPLHNQTDQEETECI